MADIRIKDLATTATTTASDDFMALDGATNGTRKMSAANPSVTTLTTSGVIASGGSVHGANGSAANPSFAFLSDQNTGLYRIGAGNIGVAANGAKVLDIATTGLTVTGALGASSLTSPASIDLTLGLGTGGTALTLASSTLAATFAGAVTVSGGGIVLNGATKVIYFGNPPSDYLYFDGSNLTTRLGGSDRLTISSVGIVTISNTNAGSSGAGALVVAGGISAAGASYFGGAIEAASLNLRPISNSPFDQSAWIKNTGNSGVFFVNLDASKYAGLKEDGTFATNGVISSSGATFAGAVSITGNVGFYGQAATAKPTGVAVTAAAIHTALVTLNLIAA